MNGDRVLTAETFGFQVKYMRQLRGMSVEELAEKSGLPVKTILRIEAVSLPSLNVRHLDAVSAVFGLSIYDLLTSAGRTPPET